LLVEGAGGLLVPLNPDHLTADFIAALKMPVLVVARSTLGTINHTLLTLEALRSRSILVGGIVMNGPPNPENRLAIETYGKVAVLGEMPRFDRLTPDGLRDWAVEHLDPQGALLPYLKVAT
jgi:malonyl-CoA O-methyltransferase